MRPISSPSRMATILTLLVLLLVPLATGIGLFIPGFYRDTAWMIPQARGQDLITLVVAEPLLLAALIAARRGRIVALLVWMGTLSYLLYTYAMYSFTAYFNALFLVYVALFSASLFALIDLLVHLDLEQVRTATRSALPRRTTTVYLAVVGLFFLIAWLGQIVPAILHGSVPAAVMLAKTPTSAVHVQDLAVVIPLLFTAAVWLWQRRPWGIALAALLLIVADVMLLAILAMGLFSAQAGIVGALDLFWVFVALTAVSLVITVVFLMHLRGPVALDKAERQGATPVDSLPDLLRRHSSPGEQSLDPHGVAGR